MMINRKMMVLPATVLLATVMSGSAAERSVRFTDLPSAVRKTAQEQSKGAVIKRYIKDNEGGRLEYEVEMTIDGHSKDVAIAADGMILEVEEQVDWNALPDAVRRRIQIRSTKGTITKVESITKKGQIVAYEAQVQTVGKHSEIQVGPDGQALQHEE